MTLLLRTAKFLKKTRVIKKYFHFRKIYSKVDVFLPYLASMICLSSHQVHAELNLNDTVT